MVDKYLEAHARSHIPVGAGEVVTPKELSELRQAFLTMDVNNNGYSALAASLLRRTKYMKLNQLVHAADELADCIRS